MAFSPDSFKKAIGKPMGAPPAPGGKPGGDMMDMDSLMGAPPGGMGEDEPGDIEGAGGEAGENSLQQALESAGYQPSPDVLNQIKALLGDAGGNLPDTTGGEDMGGNLGMPPPPPAAKGPTSKIGKLFGK